MLIHDMVGRDVSLFYQRQQVPIGDVMFEARNLSGNGVKHASLSVRSGEILGIAGMVGSGRTELAELLFGVKKAVTGEFLINGKKVQDAHAFVGHPATGCVSSPKTGNPRASF